MRHLSTVTIYGRQPRGKLNEHIHVYCGAYIKLLTYNIYEISNATVTSE